MRRLLALAGAAAIIGLGAGSANASHTGDDRNCSDFPHPVIISNGYDPAHLDGDGDGVGCQGNPGDPVKTDLYADLSDGASSATPTATPELAETGAWGPAEHPVRWMAAGGALIVGGGAAVAVTRRKKEAL
jgi:hypothetical protein